MTIKEFFSFKANKYFWLNLMAMVAVVCLLFFGVLKWLDSYTRHGEAVVVPNVKGMTIESKRGKNNLSDYQYIEYSFASRAGCSGQ